MKYKYKPGDIIFVRPRGLMFKLIRWWTQGAWGHVGLIAGYIEDHPIVIEANTKGIDTNDLKWRHVLKEDYVVYRLKGVSDEKIKAVVTECLTYVGTPYDKKALVNFIIGRTWFGTDKEMYCSEMAYRAFLSQEIVPDTYDPEKISPANLYKLIEDMVELIEEVDTHATS